MTNPIVSVAIPTRNRARLLRESLSTILAQTYEPLEILISDNASTDDTEALCASVAASDSRVRYVRHAGDIGIHGNHNFCIEHTRGEFVGFCHDDDLYSPTMVEENAAFLMREPTVGVVCPDWTLVDENGTRLGERVFEGSPVTSGLEYIERTIASGRSSVCLPGALFRRAALGSSRLPATGPLGFADFVLCFEVAERWSVGHVQRKLWSYRQHPRALSRRTIEETMSHFAVNLDQFFEDHVNRWPAHASEVARWRILARRYAFWALVYELCLNARPAHGASPTERFRSVFELADYRLNAEQLQKARASARGFAQSRTQRLILAAVEGMMASGLNAPLVWASQNLRLARTILRAK